MSSKFSSLKSRIAMVATAGLTGALLASSPLAANAAATVVGYTSTDRAAYPELASTGGNGGVSWLAFPDEENNNAPQINGATNWRGRAGWGVGDGARNFAVQDDGSGTNNALWVQKAKAGCPNSGIQLAKLANGSSLISSANKVISIKVKAFDASVPVEATLTDINGGNVLKVTATAATANTYNTLSFNFANATTGTYVSNFSYTTLSLVMDPANAIAGTGTNWGTCGDGANASKAYILDNLTYTAITGADTPPGPDVPHKLTFEADDVFGPLAVGDPVDGTKWAGQFEGAGTGVANPPVAKSGKALEIAKAGNPWSGVNLFQAPAGEQITSADYKVVSFDYFSPDSVATPMQVKMEGTATALIAVDAVPGWNHFDLDMSTASGWSASAQFTKLVMFPDFKDNGVGPATSAPVDRTGQKYYVDNVTFNGFALPTKTGAQKLTGTAKVGKVLTAGGATFAGNRITRSFKWYRCTVQGKTVKATLPAAADKCSAISGATAATYTLKSADKGKFIRVALTATTAAGTVNALTTSTSKVG